MTSTLGAAFGIAVVTTIYTALSVNHPAYLAATIAFIVGAGLVFIAFIAAYCLIPKKCRYLKGILLELKAVLVI